MKKFEVTFIAHYNGSVIVEATSEEDARDYAQKELRIDISCDNDQALEFNRVVEIEEVSEAQ